MQRGAFTSVSLRRTWGPLDWSAKFHGQPFKMRLESLCFMSIQVFLLPSLLSFSHQHALEADDSASGVFIVTLPSFQNFHWCSNRNCRPSWVLCQNNPNCEFFVQCFQVEYINKKQCSRIYQRWYTFFKYDQFHYDVDTIVRLWN